MIEHVLAYTSAHKDEKSRAWRFIDFIWHILPAQRVEDLATRDASTTFYHATRDARDENVCARVGEKEKLEGETQQRCQDYLLVDKGALSSC